MSTAVSAYDQNLRQNSFGWYISPRAPSNGKIISQHSYETSTSCYGSDESINSSSDVSIYKISSGLPKHKRASFYTNENDEEEYSIKSLPSKQKQAKYGPSTGRWFVLLVVCVSVAVRSFVSVVFGQINDVFSAYFNVDPSSVDWITNLSSLTTLVCIFIMALCNQGGFRLRSLCLWMAWTGFIGTVLLTWAMTSREYGYAMSLCGQMFMGANNAIEMTIPPVIATTWFPQSEIATALGFTLTFVGVGEALGSYLPGVVVFFSDDAVIDFIEGSGEFQSGDNEDIVDQPLIETVRYKLVMLFVFTAGINAIVLVLMCSFLKERPSRPPSNAERVVRKLHTLAHQHQRVVETDGNVSDSTCSVTTTVYNSYESSKGVASLLRNKMFLLTATLYGVVAASASTSITLLSSMIRIAFDSGIQSDALSGKIMTVMWICFVLGSFGAGRILDKYRCYRALTLTGLFGITAGCLGLSISLYQANVPGLYASHIILGFSMASTETALFETASEVTYPAPPLTFAAILTFFWMIFFVAYPIIGRYLLNNVATKFGTFSNNTVVGIASSAPWFCAFICLLSAVAVFYPAHNRSNRNSKKSTETTPLLNSANNI